MSVEALKQIWPEWQLYEKPLGKGSFGVVYKAVRRDHNVESYAAIKIISIPTDSSEVDSLRSEGLNMNATKTYLQGIVNDFVSEIQLMESLKGIQNIVSVEDYKVVEKTNEIGWDLYIRMELLTPFNTYLCNRKMTELDVIKLGYDICTALEICAKRNIIHRDIKPENIFINDFGDFKLGDFGIARKMENVTGGLSQKGTFNYMAPEVAKSNKYDARVDIYSLGIVLYRLLNGNRLPFLDTEAQLLNPNERRNAIDRRLRGEILPPPCDASPAMANLILRACAYEPTMRFSSAAEMKQALLHVANGTYQVPAASATPTVCVQNDPAKSTVSSPASHSAAAQQAVPTVHTFTPAAPKKKRKLPIALISLLIVALLAGAAFVAVPKLIGGAGAVGSLSKSDDFSEYSKQQISTFLTDAEALAANGDYEGALSKIQTGLAAYPTSTDLQQKADEYAAARDTQAQEKTLADAKSFVDSGDYSSAIALLQKALQTQSDNEAYQNTLSTYCNAYKTSATASADSLATSGDYAGAMKAIQTAAAVLSDDAELSAKATEYENKYVADATTQADTLAAQGDYDSAISLLETAKAATGDNDTLTNKIKELTDSKPVYAELTSLKVVDSSYYYGLSSDSIMDTYGNMYLNAGTFTGTGTHYATFYTSGQYKILYGTIAAPDSIGEDAAITVNIYADDTLLQTIPSITRMTKPVDISLDISGADSVKVEAITTNTYPTGILFKLNVSSGAASPAPNYTSSLNYGTKEAITNLKVVNSSHYYSTKEAIMDTYGNLYASVGSFNNTGTNFATYYTAGKYSLLTGTIALPDSINSETVITVNIYADDQLIYTLPSISRTTKPTAVSLDISGADTIKVEGISNNQYPSGVMFDFAVS